MEKPRVDVRSPGPERQWTITMTFKVPEKRGQRFVDLMELAQDTQRRLVRRPERSGQERGAGQ